MASRRAWLLAVLLAQAPAVPAQELARPFTGTDLQSGREITLADYRGRVVLVDFWASWCPPCLESLPAYDRLRDELGSEAFEVISINVDEDTADGLAFLRRRPVSFPVLADPDGEIGIPWGIRTLPHAFLLDRDGRIVASYRSFEAGDEQALKRQILELVPP